VALASLAQRPVSLPGLLVEAFGTALAVIAVVWRGWVVLWLLEHRG